jgi:hypothetical protein
MQYGPRLATIAITDKVTGQTHTITLPIAAITN